MKKQTIILAAVVLIAVASLTSCQRKCRGGGWYGDRNLGYVPTKEQPAENQMKLEDDEENCSTAEP